MFLSSLSLCNVLTIESVYLTFDTDPHTSNVNILIGPSWSGKSIFLRILYDIYQTYCMGKSDGLERHDPIQPQHIQAIRYDPQTQRMHDIEYGKNSCPMTTIIMIDEILWVPHDIEYIQNLCTEYLWVHITYTDQRYADWESFSYLWGWLRHLLTMIINLCRAPAYSICLIDEPEIHLHPQQQKLVWDIFEHISKKNQLQIFCSTHSPHMVTKENITNVYRFYTQDGSSHVINPAWYLWDESQLKQILTTSNLSKIFFAQHIILCEWEIDEYFFHRVFARYWKTNNLKHHQYDIDIIPISGKWSLRMRLHFCKRRNIQASYIWDRDNIMESHIKSEINEEKEKYNQSIAHIRLRKSQRYSGLISWIRENNQELHDKISQLILQRQIEGIFVLSQWDIEWYMWLQEKWLDVTIDFCNNHFDQWTQSYDESKKQELLDICHKVIW